jgi:hypothetical protein
MIMMFMTCTPCHGAYLRGVSTQHGRWAATFKRETITIGGTSEAVVGAGHSINTGREFLASEVGLRAEPKGSTDQTSVSLVCITGIYAASGRQQ